MLLGSSCRLFGWVGNTVATFAKASDQPARPEWSPGLRRWCPSLTSEPRRTAKPASNVRRSGHPTQLVLMGSSAEGDLQQAARTGTRAGAGRPRHVSSAIMLKRIHLYWERPTSDGPPPEADLRSRPRQSAGGQLAAMDKRVGPTKGHE
jgi:hypothetical protein